MKLLNLNVGIKLDNARRVSRFLLQNNADIVTLQEMTRGLEESVFEQFQAKANIEKKIIHHYIYEFFGPLWVGKAVRKNGKTTREFGGLIEQGNHLYSKFPILEATNEFYYKTYSCQNDWTDWEKEDHARALQIAEFKLDKRTFQILNVHGIWTKNKLGDKRTEQQCQFIVQAAKRKNIPTIITGDFNLTPNADSLKILNKNFKNLVSKYKIKSTRPTFEDSIDRGNQIVDYIFVSNDVSVTNFQVPEVAISDHLPLILEFDI